MKDGATTTTARQPGTGRIGCTSCGSTVLSVGQDGKTRLRGRITFLDHAAGVVVVCQCGAEVSVTREVADNPLVRAAALAAT